MMDINEIKEKYAVNTADEAMEMIVDLGHDYDGFSNEKDLKSLIDELVELAVLAKKLMRVPTADVEPVRHGHWELETEGFFEPEENEFYVFVNAHCSVCKEKWHSDDIRSVYHDTVHDYDYDTKMPCPITDERINKCERHCLHEAEKRILEISPFCEKCGAKMDGKENK